MNCAKLSFILILSIVFIAYIEKTRCDESLINVGRSLTGWDETYYTECTAESYPDPFDLNNGVPPVNPDTAKDPDTCMRACANDNGSDNDIPMYYYASYDATPGGSLLCLCYGFVPTCNPYPQTQLFCCRLVPRS